MMSKTTFGNFGGVLHPRRVRICGRLAPTARRHGSDGLAAYIRLGVGPDRTGPDRPDVESH